MKRKGLLLICSAILVVLALSPANADEDSVLRALEALKVATQTGDSEYHFSEILTEAQTELDTYAREHGINAEQYSKLMTELMNINEADPAAKKNWQKKWDEAGFGVNASKQSVFWRKADSCLQSYKAIGISLAVQRKQGMPIDPMIKAIKESLRGAQSLEEAYAGKARIDAEKKK